VCSATRWLHSITDVTARVAPEPRSTTSRAKLEFLPVTESRETRERRRRFRSTDGCRRPVVRHGSRHPRDSAHPMSLSTAVTASVLRPCVQRPICVVVAQVPDLSGFDRLAAAGALEHSGVDHRLQPTPQRLMRRPIPPLRSRKAPGAHRNDVVYTPAGVIVDGHPGARSMGTELVGTVDLENGERGRIESLPKRRLANTPPRRNFSVQLRARSRPRCRAAPPPRRARRDGNAPLASSTRWPAASWPFYMPHPPPRHLSLRDAGSGALSRPPVGHRLRAAVIRTRAVD
jgi:hypothetical protein